jgi:hypothetical protein
MLIFINSVLITSFICSCFFKTKFWENRYLVLLICAGVALVATLATNYSIRKHLSTRTEIAWKKPTYSFNSFHVDTVKKDTINFKSYCVITTKNEKDTCIKYGNNKTDNTTKIKLNTIYIAPSESDTVGYIIKKKLYYDTKSSNWITGFSLPRIATIKVLYIPPKEYNKIPKSLIRKIPF